MAAFDLQEQEQIAQFKAWWNDWGKQLAGVLVIALVAYAGWSGWQAWQKKQVAKAAEVYMQVQRDMADDARFKAGVDVLKNDYAATPYAARAVLTAAKVAYLRNDAALAKTDLQWVIDNARESALRDTARMHLAGVLMDDKKYDEGLNLVKSPEDEGFSALFAEARGDIQAAKGDQAAAADAYRQALAKLPKDAPNQKLVEAKLEVIGSK